MPAPSLDPPLAMLAELTHRCPLTCPYCSNPLELAKRSEELDAATWIRVFTEAAELGVLQLHLSGGEPAARRDLVELVSGAVRAGLYSNLITSGVGLDAARLASLADAGLDHVQLSIQDVNEAEGDVVAGLTGSQRRKRAFAAEVVDIGLPLTVNVVLHRGNIGRMAELVDYAVMLGAARVELAHAQYYGWGLRNRAALMPDRASVHAAEATLNELRLAHADAIAIDYVPSDHFARFPKPCVNGWGRRSLNVSPRGAVLPCHAADTIPGLSFCNVRDRSLADIWRDSPAFQTFRGTEWMRDPCRGCDRRNIDFGGCRCQAMALTGDPRNADPVCVLSPHRGVVDAILDTVDVRPVVPRGRAARDLKNASPA